MRSIFLILGVLAFMGCAKKEYVRNEGFVFGTSYHFVYEANSDLHTGIMQAIAEVDYSLSTYKDSSIISRINKNDSTVIADHHFMCVYNKALEITTLTDGAFDMTVAPLVNAWGFGFTKRDSLTPHKIDSIMAFVGMDKIQYLNGRFIKSDKRLMLDASAIAKGYGVDVAAEYLEKMGVTNYMVEIGGELRVKGVNAKGRHWSVGIDKPIDDPAVSQRELEAVLQLKNQSLATSGNYRNFYMLGEKKVAHTIHPKTGYPVQTSVLSASVIAPDCMSADAFATAFMVLGLEKSLEIANKLPELDVYLIYSDERGELKEAYTSGFDTLIKK